MEKVAALFFEFCNRRLEIFRLMRQSGLSGYLLEAFNKELIVINKVTENKFSHQLPFENAKYALAFNAGGMWNIVNIWIDNGAQEPYTELVNAFKEISSFNAAQ